MMEHIFYYIRGALSMVVGGLSYVYGDLDGVLIVLFGMIILDYVTGVISAGVQKKLSSNVGFNGLLRKVLILLVVGMGGLIDHVIGTGATVRNMLAMFYIANEGLSIIENANNIGLPVPKKILSILETMRKESEKDDL